MAVHHTDGHRAIDDCDQSPHMTSLSDDFLDGSPLKKYLKQVPKPKRARGEAGPPATESFVKDVAPAPAGSESKSKTTLFVGMNLGSARSCLAGGGTRLAVDTCSMQPTKAAQGSDSSSEEFQDLLHYIVGLAEPDPDAELCAVIGVPAQASNKTKHAIIEASRGILHRVMLVPEPFAVAYGIDRTANALVVDIGAATTDLCRLNGAFPTTDDNLSIPVAGNTIDRKLYDLIKIDFPNAEITLNLCKQFKERHGFVSDPSGPVHARFTAAGVCSDHDISSHLHRACSTVVDPIVTGVQQLLATTNPNLHKSLLSNVVLSGGGAMLDGLDQRLLRELANLGGGQITAVDDPLFAAATGALKLAQDVPATYWQQLH